MCATTLQPRITAAPPAAPPQPCISFATTTTVIPPGAPPQPPMTVAVAPPQPRVTAVTPPTAPPQLRITVAVAPPQPRVTAVTPPTAPLQLRITVAVAPPQPRATAATPPAAPPQPCIVALARPKRLASVRLPFAQTVCTRSDGPTVCHRIVPRLPTRFPDLPAELICAHPNPSRPNRLCRVCLPISRSVCANRPVWVCLPSAWLVLVSFELTIHLFARLLAHPSCLLNSKAK